MRTRKSRRVGVIAGLLMAFGLTFTASPAVAVEPSPTEGPVVSLVDPTVDNRYVAGEFVDMLIIDGDLVDGYTIKLLKGNRSLYEYTDTGLAAQLGLTVFDISWNTTGAPPGTYTIELTGVDTIGNVGDTWVYDLYVTKPRTK